jgi:MerR family transcriptional regulator, light-induced transcriptional regulator
MTPGPNKSLELQAAADALGVHYQTAYRWVRTGKLPAQLIGNKYQVARHDLDTLQAARTKPAAPAAPSPKRIQRQAELVDHALLEGDETTVRNTAQRLTEEGTSIIELIQSVFTPPLRRIGQKWHDGELPIWVEHRAAAIIERTLGDLAPNPRGRRRGTAIVAAVAGDQHSLPTTMAAVALREANWHVHHLGANMPGNELIQFCAQHHIDLAVISLTNPDTSNLANNTANQIRATGTPTIIGGPGRSLKQLINEAEHATRPHKPH